MLNKNAEFSLVKQPNLVLCANTNTQVTRKNAYEFPIPGSRAWWWQCSSCRGWHVTVEKTDYQGGNLTHFSPNSGYAILGVS